MASGLSVSDVVNVTVSLAPPAAQSRSFGTLLILGASDVIDTSERLRLYTSITGVAQDFGVSAPEYTAAALFFSQSPQPTQCYIGRFAQTPTSGILHGATLPASQQAIANFTAITAGSMTISVDGTSHPLTGLNFASATNLNGVATLIGAALTQATVTWDSVRGRFNVESKTTGASSAVSYATPSGSGTDISALTGLSLAAGASVPIVGLVAESAAAAVQALCSFSSNWYGLMFAATLVDADTTAVAAIIEAQGVSRIFGATTAAPGVIDPTQNGDLASVLSAAAYTRTFLQYSSSSPYAVASMFGRAFSVDFTGSNTAITLMFKQEPGVTPETLTETQAATLTAKRCNYMVNYNNSTAILQNGVMCSGMWFDTRHAADWLQNYTQTAVYNVLYTSPTKVPQTDPGVHTLVNAVDASIAQAVNNGVCAPGTWRGQPFGTINTGDTLTKGYYIYAPSVSSQSTADRSARKAPPIQVAANLAGAVHSASVAITMQ